MFGALTATPMMVIRGELSDILLPDTVKKMQDQHPQMTLVEVPDIGHAPLLEDPQVFRETERFLAAALAL